MTREQVHALYRDLGTPVVVNAPFKLLGIKSHIKRLIMLDVLIRQYQTTPEIERYEDDSLRYHLARTHRAIRTGVEANAPLHVYTRINGDWITLYSPICKNCLRPHKEHLNNKCLFEASTWLEFDVPPWSPAYFNVEFKNYG